MILSLIVIYLRDEIDFGTYSIIIPYSQFLRG